MATKTTTDSKTDPKPDKPSLLQSLKSILISHKSLIFSLILFIIFFSFSIIITYDSAHYLSYVEIFEGAAPFSSWDIVRGPAFPLVIYWSNSLFGTSPQGLLICMFLFYSVYVFSVWQILSALLERPGSPSKPSRLKTALKWLLFLFAIFNPIIFGYAHTLLTEFIAIPLAVVSIHLAWLFYKSKRVWPFALFFALAVPFSWSLKQPYVCLTLIPLLASLVFSFFLNKSRPKKLNFLALLLPVLSLAVYYFGWNFILSSNQVSTESDRSSAGLLSSQLSQTFSSDNKNLITTLAGNLCATSSVCVIKSDNSTDYYVTSDLDFINAYENNIIPYRLYTDGIINSFPLSETSFARIAPYSQLNNAGISYKLFNPLEIPTNIIYKLAILILPFATFILLTIYIIVRKKDRFSAPFVLLSIINITVILTLIANAFVGLIIDRYSVELFTPSLISFTGSITLLYDSRTKSPKTKNPKKPKTATPQKT